MKRKIIAAVTLTNNHSITVHEIEHSIEDTIKFSDNNQGEIFAATIEYKEDGEAFFKHGEYEIFMNELVRADIWEGAK
ncbi:hypothetical protein M3_0182 [Lysinibacillus phage vB_LfM_LysYB1]|nr:hypothetical protein M3_0182 [Lysinibacillus phage vB_LfM_LysYB1]WAB25306.1 hypothetical protein M5_0128 [Lysinibacillus phage vB_LfM_LysYB2]